MYETDMGTGEAPGKKIRRKAGKCVKKLLPNAEIKNFFIHSMKIYGIDICLCFCICGQNSADSTCVFWLLLHSLECFLCYFKQAGTGLEVGS